MTMEIQLHKNKQEILDTLVNGFKPIIISTDEFLEYLEISNDGFILTNKWILKLKKEKRDELYSIQVVSTYVKVLSCYQNSSSNERTYNIEIFNGKEYLSVIIDSTVLTTQGCKELLKYGCIFNETDNKVLLEYLSNSAFSAPIKNVHDSLGWN